MSRTPRTLPVLATVIVLLAATAMVPGAQATTVVWILTNEDSPVISPGKVLATNTQDHGTDGTVPLPDATPTNWITVVATDQDLDLNGTWGYDVTLSSIAMSTVGGDATFEIGLHIFNDTTGMSTIRGSTSEIITPLDAASGSHRLTGDIEMADGIIAEGEYIEIVILLGGASANVEVSASSSSNPSSFIFSPDSDPNFPVWELGSLMLLGAGLVVVAGVVYTKRQKQD